MARFNFGEQPLESGSGDTVFTDNPIDGNDSNAIDALGAVELPSSGNNGGDDFDPAIHVGRDKRNSDGSYTRKRGRRTGSGSAGSGNSQKRTAPKAGIETLTNVLLLVHLGLSNATKTPELALTETEGKTLATAVNDVLVEFDIKPDPKITAVVGLVMTAGSIYGPRAYLIRERIKEERAEKRQQYS